MFSRIELASSILALLVATGHGAADDPLEGLPSDVARQVREHLPGVVLERRDDVPPLTRADQWLPLEPVDYEFEPSGGGKSVRWSIAPARRLPGRQPSTKGWTLVDTDGTTRFLELEKDGTIQSRFTVNHPNGLLITLDPPEPVVRPVADEGKAGEIEIKVADLATPSDVRFSGKALCTWSDLGGFRVKVPAGEFDVRLLRVHYKGGVGPASVDGSRLLLVAPGTGPVAFSVDRDISAFIFFNDDTRHAGVLRKTSRGS